VDTGVFALRYALAAVHATIGLAGQHKAGQYAGHETVAHLDGLPQHPQRAATKVQFQQSVTGTSVLILKK